MLPVGLVLLGFNWGLRQQASCARPRLQGITLAGS